MALLLDNNKMQSILSLGTFITLILWIDKLVFIEGTIERIILIFLAFNALMCCTPGLYEDIKDFIKAKADDNFVIEIGLFPFIFLNQLTNLRALWSIILSLSVGMFLLYFNSFMLLEYENRIAIQYIAWSFLIGLFGDKALRFNNFTALIFPLSFFINYIKELFIDLGEYINEAIK